MLSFLVLIVLLALFAPAADAAEQITIGEINPRTGVLAVQETVYRALCGT